MHSEGVMLFVLAIYAWFVFSSQIFLAFGAPKVLPVCFLINSLLKLRAKILIFIVLFKGPSLGFFLFITFNKATCSF